MQNVTEAQARKRLALLELATLATIAIMLMLA